MKAIAVPESLWGNTAAVDCAMAEDMGAEGAGGGLLKSHLIGPAS
jgi:hypothetical protein